MSRAVAATALTAMLVACGGGGSSAPPVPMPTQTSNAGGSSVQISADTFTDPLGQHATEVEPSAVARGQTIVAAFQIARQLVAGGSALGVAVSPDGGRTWAPQALPLVTRLTGGTADSASDAVVAYDPAHGVWLVSLLPVLHGIVPFPEVSRSSDGIHWGAPVPVGSNDTSDDKEWVACDGIASSPHYGSCYVAWDDDGRGGLLEASVSHDGGTTWSSPQPTADRATGIGAQADPLPNGDVILVSDDFNEQRLFAAVSHDGGASWSATHPIAQIADHFQAGGLRSGALVSTGADSTGTVYAVWQDCRFEAGCAADDLVFATSRDGIAWTAPRRIPADPIGSGIDHFIPGLGIAASAGAATRLGLTYYTYARSACGMQCRLSAAYVASDDGGLTWTAPIPLGTSMSPDWLALTTEGSMVADYVATVFQGASPVAIFAQAGTRAALFDEAIDAYRPAAPPLGQARRAARLERAVPGFRSDHGPRHLTPRD